MTYHANVFTRSFGLIAALGALSACGNSATGLGPATDSRAVEGTVTVDSDGNFVANGVPVTNMTEIDNGLTNGTLIERYSRDNTSLNEHQFYGETDSVYAGVYSSEFQLGDTEALGAMAGRIGTTDIPASGTATYTGEYRGFINEETGVGTGIYDDTVYLVTGDVELNANFLTDTIGGEIDNRTLLLEGIAASGDFASDVALPNTTIDGNGLFSSSVIGATINDGGSIYTATTGGYSGVIAGSDGQEVAGTTSMIFTRAGSPNYGEAGVFIATE